MNQETRAEEFDYIVVGAGSAGCVVASRLSEDDSVRVLLLEYGKSDRSMFIQMPTALSIPMNTKRFAWQFFSEPEPGLDDRRMHCPRGKVLGGSSSINGMVYVRGHARDFDEWAEQGADGWDFHHCLPYFRKADDWKYGSDAYRNQGGPLSVNNGNEMKNPLYRSFIEAGAQAGYAVTEDYNGYRQEGFGPMHMTVRDGVRWSTANAYLRPALGRSNLKVVTGALTRRVRFEQKRAVGVEYRLGERERFARAGKEVILCAGSIGSPQLLQISGVGPGQVLKDAGIEVVHELPGVGENLQDHLEFYFQFRCRRPITLNGKLDPWSKLMIGMRWKLFRTGLGATNHFESCAFIRSDPGIEWPDIQYHFLPGAMRYDGRAAFGGHGFQVHVGHNKPKSRGHVRVKSGDPLEKPSILFNYLGHEHDRHVFRQCVRLTREIMAQPAMDPYRGDEIQPGEDVRSDEEIDAWIRQGVESAYHPSCTCRMGRDRMAVVDPETRVRGMQGLRVVDSSIFPVITNGNLNAPTIMAAERGADLIRNRGMLEPSDAPVAIADNWEHSQR
ncbi:MAG: choline dehydrogenase [Gammaproteobacteria bacterium]|nr:choline dehydrogenase [Gammaproteobacteria bacterium]MYD75981.1 choline dehydrogenase [Gammaproteobacteria bacterium]MYJ51830.1 choline dehydrogenase [Gammaproteobacteria bacterium]